MPFRLRALRPQLCWRRLIRPMLVSGSAKAKTLAPEVEAVVSNSKGYSTKQLSEAQLKAVQNGEPG